MAKNKRKIYTVNITDKMGERLKSAREERGYTRELVSERSGISVRYIVAIENEGSIPKLPLLNDLLRGMALSADAIFYPELQSDPMLDQFTHLFCSLDDRERKIVLDVMNSLIDSRESI